MGTDGWTTCVKLVITTGRDCGSAKCINIYVILIGLLSRLVGDPIYEMYARRAVKSLWQIRDNSTGLFGYVMNIHSKAWVSQVNSLLKR